MVEAYQEANGGVGGKGAKLRQSSHMELKGFTEEFNMRNDLTGWPNLLLRLNIPL